MIQRIDYPEGIYVWPRKILTIVATGGTTTTDCTTIKLGLETIVDEVGNFNEHKNAHQLGAINFEPLMDITIYRDKGIETSLMIRSTNQEQALTLARAFQRITQLTPFSTQRLPLQDIDRPITILELMEGIARHEAQQSSKPVTTHSGAKFYANFLQPYTSGSQEEKRRTFKTHYQGLPHPF